MIIRKIFMILFACISYCSFGACVYCICYETMDIFGPERAKYFLDLTPYFIMIFAGISVVFLAISVILYKSIKRKNKA